VSKYKNTPVSSNAAVERIFSEPRIFFVDDDSALSPLLGQSASGLKAFIPSFSPPLVD
jgi:hypothetical protein